MPKAYYTMVTHIHLKLLCQFSKKLSIALIVIGKNARCLKCGENFFKIYWEHMGKYVE